MKKITLGLLALLFAVQSIETKAQTVVINEILASNNVSIQDEDSSHQDWIELYNTGSTSVNLLGFGLSDDPLLLYKWTFPNVSLGAGQYLIVWASDKNRSVAGSPLHTNFKISASGEALYLTNTVGTTISTVPAANLQADISYGKYPNGTGPYVFFGTPTPNAVNATAGFSQALNPPVFSQSSGFLTAGFNLTISSPDPGTTILYTLDGSEPDENNLSGTTYNYKNQYPKNPGQAFGPFLYNSFTTLQYSAPIAIADRSSQANKVSAMSTTYDFTPPYIPNGPIYKGNIIRAKVIKPGALSSKVVTKNYFITPSGPAKYSLPVLSFSFTENQLYDYEDGIAVAGVDFDNWRTANPNEIPDREFGNFERSGIENERKANMHYFVNGLEKINQDVGIRIRGAYSRVYPSKSWNIAARSDFGDDNLSHKFFADEPYTSYERLSAKSGGSDFYNTMFRDAMNHQLVKDLRMETESFQPMVVFMNGEYWGLLNMREKYDNNYFKQVYNIDAVDLLENQGAIQEGDAVDYNNMYSYISSNTFTSDANYAYIQTRMDTDNFIDYFTTNIFAQNDDWPGNNIIYWRKKTAGFVPNAPYGHDGRWRWAIHDMDSTLDEPNYNSLQDATSTIDVGPNPSWSTLILRKLLANTTFKNDFINRFADLMNTNFLSTRIVAKIDEISAIIAPEMPDQYFRWKAPLNNSDWQYHLNEEKEFANERPAFQRSHIRSKFSISSNINATLNVSNYNHGYVKISTIEIKDGTPGITGNPYPWTGIYFSGIPLKLKAIAKPGYIFSNWTGASTSTNAEITITPTANFSITAVFVPDGITDVSVPIYFWMMDGNIVNGAQLTSLNSTYELASNGVIQYQSCNTGYPTTNAGKSSMERRNNPTTINYRQTVNGNIPYATSDMKGLQIKQPFQSGGLENTMVFNFSTLGYKKIKFSFAGVDEGAASAIAIDYAVNAGTPIWITTGLTSSSLPLTAVYQLFEVDFSTISTVDNNSNFKIRLRFTGPNMTADLGNRVTFNNIAVDGVKIPLSYPSPNIFNVGTAITNLAPSTTRVMTSYSIAPSLPDGLTLNTTSGIISGTPTAASVATNYTVTGTYASGTETFVLNITVNDSAPTSLTYASPNIFTKGVGIATLTPTSSGGAVVSYSVSPSLPAGLSLDVTTGAISGIPTAITSVATYTVTAINSGGSTSFGVVITVKDLAPSALSYTSPNIFTKSVAIANLVPTSSGGAVVNYTVFPTLPAGLSLNNTTGVISGTPTTISGTANYTVTANNTGGSTNFGISIRVNDVAPSALSYNSPNIYTRGITITSLNPAVSGGAVTSYSISPSLPSGLSFSTSTGRISGTPTAIAATATYTVTATNTGGSTTFGVVITVNDIAPNALTYTSPNVFTRGTTISNLNPSVSGGIVTSYSITPSLPSGLSFSTSTGRISGTPTAIAATATYTVTATNTGGSTTFGVVITVNDIAPSTLSYISPNVFTLGSTIIDLTPIVSGTVLNYSISPVLPNGLSFETSTGIISGTPTAIAATATYTVTAFNSGGSTTFGVVITVNDIAPSALTYTSPNVFTRGTTISNLDPTISGGIVTSYSISPSLPSGLSFSTSTGRISGTPTAIAATLTYTVTATNTGGATTFGVVITVNDIAPSGLTYNSPNVFTRGTTISNLDPSVSGGTVTSYSISPALPTGLTFNTSTGRISGTPTAIASTATYTVTAFNSGGSTTFGVVITVNDVAPSGLSYNSPNVFTLGNTIADLTPTVSGTVLSYSISPSLPNGLSFSTSTGRISGTPTAIASTATYTVTAFNSGGSTTFGVVITVNDIAPSGLSYNSPNVFTLGNTTADLTPTVSGTVLSYSISPSLPDGLSFDTSTGRISGTPTAIASTATYTVTAFNSGGSTTFGVVITVNDIAPSALTYTSPNVFTRGTTISNLDPTISGGIVASYSISPSLPTGLSFSTSTGRISGTPTAIAATATYTVTAFNSGGSTTFGVVITVNDVAPGGLTYNSPNVFTLGNNIADLTPTISGTVLSYSISPSLPGGLSFDTATGIISGTPIAIAATATYTVTAFNSGGSTTFGVVITVNDIAPSALSYTSPNVFTLASAIADLTPVVSGTVLSYSISPSLPNGLSFDTSTGIISGTPTTISSTATYTVTAFNSGGSTTFDVVITVNDIAPSALTYNSPNIFTRGTTISNLDPSVSGGIVTSYSISPSLPVGLSLNTTTGRISGTPTAISATATYTVTASNTGGSTTFGVVITVNDIAPSALSYISPNVFTRGTTISNLNPSVSGGIVTSYSISPSLPVGLSLNTTTGRISGTPTAISATATYTVTASNTGGSTTFGVVITVNDIAPSALSYISPNVFTRGTTISNLDPTISGGIVTSYSISPALPSGLSFSTSTGRISGTPTVIAATATYTVTAFNSGGSTTFGVVITVNDVAPNTLSYTSPNVFTLGSTIIDLTPIVSGTVLNYSISPSLPNGLSFETSTGVISGTPTAISSTATYTVTAFNSGGSVSFDVEITVNDVAPSALSYTTPNVFTLGNTIADLTPIVSGIVLSYSISPSLPNGLSFDTSTGIISGTPTTISSTATYTVTAFNSGGNVSFDIEITVNDVAPSALSYTSPNVFTRGTTISNLDPTISGGIVTSYSISPALPSGLSFSTSTGRISGTPTAIAATATYTVTAFNSGGSTTFGVVITVNDIAPSTLSYISPNVFTRGTTISNLDPSVSGGIVTSYSISPTLPTGLSFSTSTGRISGTPTAISSTATYTVTAFNSGGSTTFDVVITVNDIAPSALSYISPNVFTRGTTISNLDPSVSGGIVTSYSISPSLPVGLSLNTTTGRISGTPTAISATATYTVTAFNSGGSTTFGVVITVNDIAPSALSYISPNVFTRGTTISNLDPTISGGIVTSYSISPALPSGLSFSTSTGRISGTPTAIAATATYTVTAFNSGGSTTFGVVITVNDIAPSTLSYISPNVFTRGTTISNLDPSVSGGIVTSYSISPTLPTGLSFSTSTGRISGTPTAISSTATYTVTAFNSGGSASFDIEITINDVAPTALSYTTPNVFTLGNTIADLTPVVSGTVLSYSISPSLPNGLSFDTSTGIISGTPTAISSTATYTVTAFNSGGSASFDVEITVNDVAPTALSYTTPNVFTLGSTIVDLTPIVSGTVLSYSVSPSLPNGLSFDTSTGIISGTPTSISSTATYTVTAFNSGGSASFDIEITINDVAPTALSYTTPNVFTLGNTIADLTPVVSGTVLSYSISPSLPNGLSFDTSTGIISGTPTAISSTATYTVTAFNSGGSASFDVEITVNDVAPTALSYTTPNVFTLGNTIADLTPVVSGTVLSYSISPSLPNGLSFDTSTGIISGTPTTISSTATYIVTAFNSGGSVSFDVEITVNDVAPNALSYTSPNVFTLGNTIADLTPVVSGTILSFSVSPSLPNGLSFDTSTGIISGTPTAIAATATYTVTAFNSGGSTTFGVVITVNDVAPTALSYTTPNVFTLGSTIVDLTPIVSGTVSSYSISPSLPNGLSFDTSTGIISGTPTSISSTATYTVTAFNSGGSASFDIEITINDVAPTALSYTTPNVFTLGNTIADLTPVVSGTVLSYSISPSLPNGLSFDTSTGIISGTPTAISSTATYTVTAFNSGGSASFDVEITVNDVAPTALSYTTPNVFTLGNTIADLTPIVSGTVLNYSVSPSLPNGLSFDTSTGIISGTPTAISSTATYTVTAFNSGGSVSFDLEITVETLLNNSEIKLDTIFVYPNPFIDSLHVTGAPANISYTVFSVDGKLIQEGLLSSNTINITHVPSGVYFLRLFGKGNQERTFKIIKR